MSAIDPVALLLRCPDFSTHEAAAAEAKRTRELGVRVSDAPSFDSALEILEQLPPVLYARGRTPRPGPRVAVVGSRRASAAGCRQAYRLGRDLAEAGVDVVSGLARGIDAAALEGAVAGGGCPGAVLGNGFPRIYPPENRALADRMEAAGGFLVSEFALGSPPRRYHFPRRNRLISALSSVVVVVEAALKSGSLITVGWALDQGKDVCAYPGPAESPENEGCHQLIREGATLVTGCADVLAALFGVSVLKEPRWERVVEQAIANGARSLEEVARVTGLPAAKVLQGWERFGLTADPEEMS